MPLVVFIGAMSSVFVFVATLSFIKTPADNGMRSHVRYVRELLDSRLITAVGWTETRDMQVNGAATGSVGSLLHTRRSLTSEII